ncbi:hypothetical protein BXZ70DRAFT_1003680 [Cristinia sonorae]|uniref:Uncharacterized protein n=1 Tax=Cristinia sonorae TaxID=1940300 RepID=A0A8K0UY86_9AGAR|nr:hypothetical protein BXZ70DRAFT_1003680 [Cristinia sonorae]
MFSGDTAKDPSWKAKEQADEARYAHEKETSQLQAIREKIREQEAEKDTAAAAPAQAEGAQAQNKPYFEKDFEGGFGGQEDLEDRYATTSGEH